jgi:hypothetical protein
VTSTADRAGKDPAQVTGATTDQERVLVRHGLAEQHNQAGLHRGNGLPGFLAAIPFEPTAPLGLPA